MRLVILTTGFIARASDPLKVPRTRISLTALAVLAAVVPFAGCSRSTPGLASQGAPASAVSLSTATDAPAAQGQKAHTIRATGLIRALESQSIRVPQLAGTGIRLTVTRIITNGSKVSKDDVLAQFDPTAIVDTERDAKAKLAFEIVRMYHSEAAAKKAQENFDEAQSAELEKFERENQHLLV